MMPFAASILVKVTVIMALALCGARLARKGRAAVRHVLLAAAFVVVLVLPLASIVAPSVRVEVPIAAQVGLVSAPPRTVPDAISADAPAAAGVVITPATARSRWPSLSALVMLFGASWAAGAVLFVLPVAAGLWQIRAIRRSGLPWRTGRSVVDRLALDAGIRRPVDLILHESLAGPMTCGLLRPAVVLPMDVQAWADEDLRRAIVHELEHVRRVDSVTQCLARFVCAIYWFHPLVWAAWRQLSLEAERACDDAVLASAALSAVPDPSTAYADQLVVLAKRLTSASHQPQLAMANRHDLATRVVAVLDSRQPRGRAGIGAVAATCAAAAVLAVAILPLRIVAAAQTSGHAFEVASVKPKGPFRGPAEVGVSLLPGGRVLAVNAPIYLLIEVAYDVSPQQIDFKSVEGKLLEEVFDIEAKAGVNALPDSAPKEAREERLRQMLQTLLAERFKLALHKETRQVPVYALVVAPGGPRLKLSPADRACPADVRCGRLPGGPASGVKGLDVEISKLVETLESFGDRHIVDRTGIKGRFDIDLPPWTRSPGVVSSSSNIALEPAEDPNDPTIFAVLQRQLGLRLEPIRSPLEIHVVDHIERPTLNGGGR